MHYRMLILLFLIPPAANAQIKLYNLSLTDSTKAFLYIGVDNDIKINWAGLNPANYTITVNQQDASIAKKNDSVYIIRISKINNNCRINIHNKKGVLVLDKPYTSALILYNELTWNGFRSNDKVSRDSLLADPVLVYDCGNNYYRCNIKVVSFVVTVDIKDSIASEPATGNRLSAKQIELLRNANKDGLLTIDNIRALGPGGWTRKLPSMFFYLKDE